MEFSRRFFGTQPWLRKITIKHGDGIEKILFANCEKELEVHLMKCEQAEARSTDHYRWLRARPLRRTSTAGERDQVSRLKPLIDNMTPENAAAIAVKIDSFVEETSDMTADAILELLKSLLEEHSRLQIMETSLKQMKPRRKFVKSNRVKPVLMPPGREATVCFIIEGK